MIQLRITIEENGKPPVPIPFALPKAAIMVHCDVFGKDEGTDSERKALHQLIELLVNCKHAAGAVVMEEEGASDDQAGNNN